jgi:putative toxin-antitoxin system antitoxin component (TIGR02293 family)
MNHAGVPTTLNPKRDRRPREAASAAEVASGDGPRRTQLRAATTVARSVPSATTGEDRSVTFWDVKKRDVERSPKVALQSLLFRVKECPPIRLYDAVEQGVPTYVVLLLAGAFGDTAASVMNLIGVSETTFRRKEEANEPLPEVAGHRVMGFLRLVARLQRLLEESGDPKLIADFDLEGWVSEWIRNPLPELNGKTPAEMLRNPEGQRAVEELLDRMRGGLPA